MQGNGANPAQQSTVDLNLTKVNYNLAVVPDGKGRSLVTLSVAEGLHVANIFFTPSSARTMAEAIRKGEYRNGSVGTPYGLERDFVCQQCGASTWIDRNEKTISREPDCRDTCASCSGAFEQFALEQITISSRGTVSQTSIAMPAATAAEAAEQLIQLARQAEFGIPGAPGAAVPLVK